jgi:hypothetical protein
MERQIIPLSPAFAPQRSERRIDLDWVRIGAFGLLIFHPVGMLYVSWRFHIPYQEIHRIKEQESLTLAWFRAPQPGHAAQMRGRAVTSRQIQPAPDPAGVRHAP